MFDRSTPESRVPVPLIKEPKSHLPPIRDLDARDKPLDYFWTISDDSWAAIEPMLGGGFRDTVAATVRRMIACGLSAYREPGTGFVSYSRNNQFYMSKPYGEDPLFTYYLVRRGADLMDRSGLIDHQTALPGQRGFQSRYALKPETVALLEGPMDYLGRPELKLRDAGRNPLPIVDDETTRKLKAEVQELREWLRPVDFTMPECAIQVSAHHWEVPVLDKGGNQRFDDEGNPRTQIVRQDPRIDIYRVFSRGSWALNGRYHWFGQGLSKGARKLVKIDGEEVAELDFRAMHTKELYALEGIDYDGDPYFDAIDLDEQSGGDNRFNRDDEVKPALNILLNAKTHKSAIGAIAQKLGTNNRTRAEGLMTAVKAAHPLIAKHFHADVGLMLMRHEADIALAVMHKAKGRGFVALPIHDSFLCRKSREADLQACMDEAWEEWAAQFRKDGERRVVGDVFAVESEIIVPETMESPVVKGETDAFLLHKRTLPAGSRSSAVLASVLAAPRAMVRGVDGLVEPFYETPNTSPGVLSFVERAMRIYGERAAGLAQWLGGDDLPALMAYRDPADPRDIQFLLGTVGLELVGLPFEEDMSTKLHRAWGRDASTNPIPERLIKTAMTRANRKANRSAAKPAAKTKKAARKPSKSPAKACEVGFPVDLVVSSVLESFPESTVRAA